MIKNSSHSKIFTLSLLAMIFISFPLNASEIPAKLQAAIFMKILGYDSTVTKSSAKTITLHLIIDKNTGSQKKSLITAFNSIKNVSIAGKKIQIQITSPSKLTEPFSNSSLHILYIPTNSNSSTVSTTINAGKTKKIPVFAGNEQIVKKGAAVAVGVDNGKPKIIINLKQSKAMGMKLSTQILKMSKII